MLFMGYMGIMGNVGNVGIMGDGGYLRCICCRSQFSHSSHCS